MTGPVLAPAGDVAVRLVTHGDDETVPRSEVLLAGRATGWVVEGATLEAAYEAGASRRLLLLTHDVPFEESLSIHLLDDAGALLDTAWIGSAGVSGRFDAPTLRPPSGLSFDFLGPRRWHLDVLARPRLALPVVPEALGVHRPLRLRRWFALSSTPAAQR